jgi:K+-sensing histidine kinase KdpD
MAPPEDRFRGHFPGVASRFASAIRSSYVVAVAAFGGALLFRYLFRESLGLKVPYLQFYPAVMFAAWYGGLGPGVLITTLSAVVSMYFLLPPAGVAVADPADQLSLGIFVGTSLVIAWLNDRLHVAQKAHESRAERLDAIPQHDSRRHRCHRRQGTH